MPTQLTSTEKAALARRLNSSNDAERTQAQADLQALIADDVLRIRQCRALKIVASMTAFWLYLPAYVYFRIIGHHPVPAIFIYVAFSCLLLGYLASLWAKDAIRNINALDIPQAVGGLLDAISMNGWFALEDTRPALIHLLPRLRVTDANLLTPRQHKLLFDILSKSERIPWYRRYWSAELKIAILSALEQIGDEKAIPRVEKLARSARNLQVRAAAQECLPYLTVRAEQARVEQTLLRASTPAASPDTLLRPTVAASPTEPQQLLRASHTENDTNSA